MAMDPQRKERLAQFTTAVKGVIYNPERMKQFLPMLDTKNGAIQAVQAVIAVIEQKKPVPPDIAPLLGAATYMIMVDMAKDVTGMSPDPEIVKGVVGEILATMGQAYGGKTPPAGPQDPAAAPPTEEAPGGIMQKAMA